LFADSFFFFFHTFSSFVFHLNLMIIGETNCRAAAARPWPVFITSTPPHISYTARKNSFTSLVDPEARLPRARIIITALHHQS
jgi:hypothetical protein